MPAGRHGEARPALLSSAVGWGSTPGRTWSHEPSQVPSRLLHSTGHMALPPLAAAADP